VSRWYTLEGAQNQWAWLGIVLLKPTAAKVKQAASTMVLGMPGGFDVLQR
jgi:hypothetical protein